MALFKSNPEKTLQRDIDAAKANRDRLSAKLAESETVIAEHTATAQKLALDGDDAGLDRAENSLRAAQDRRSTLQAVVSGVVQQLAVLEQTKAEAADRKLRSETAAAVAAMATDLENSAKKFDTAVAELAEIAGRATMFCPDAVGLEAFATSSRVQVPPATEMVVTLIRNYAAAVLRGEGPAMLPKPGAVMPTTAPPKPVTVRLFALKAVKWIDAAGAQRFVGKYNDVDLPERAAAFALKKGICAELADPRRKQLHGLSPGHPEHHWCVDLDNETETTPDEERSRPAEQRGVHSAFEHRLPPGFEPLDRGQGYVIKTSAGNATPSEGEAA